jgi:hypothetical protein
VWAVFTGGYLLPVSTLTAVWAVSTLTATWAVFAAVTSPDFNYSN